MVQETGRPSWPARLRRVAATALIDPVDRDHRPTGPAFRRRRVVAALTLAIGATLLGISLSVRPGDAVFYLLTVLVAAVWTGGALLSGPLHLGWAPGRGRLHRPILVPVGIGLVAAAVFVAGALVVREVPTLRDPVNSVLAHARYGNVVAIILVTVLNGVAEEIFFRGALFAAAGQRHPVLVSTVVYAVATLATGNPMLVFAAVTLGLLLGLQRRATGGILAPVLTHITWSTTMLLVLPALIQQ